MIYLFTDFGYQGPYVGELKSVLVADNRQQPIIVDLIHDAPVFDPEASAYLLAALSQRFRPGDACLGVVDPGVGSEDRRPIVIEADGIFYCGPDNGLFSQVINNARQVKVSEINWRPKLLSNSFHGRDLFAPALLKLINKDDISLTPVPRKELIGNDWPNDLDKIIYIDGFGNLITGRRAASIQTQNIVTLANQRISYADTFSSQTKGQPFWYINSMGLVEIAVNQGHADDYFQVNIGTELCVTG